MGLMREFIGKNKFVRISESSNYHVFELTVQSVQSVHSSKLNLQHISYYD